MGDCDMTSNDQDPEKDWLIMLYMAGDNNLDHEMVLSLQFLLEVGPLGNDAIVAEFDSSRPGLGTQRYDFTELKGHRLEDYLEPGTAGETSTGNPDTLKAFLDWAEGEYPAERRILILSGHGSGTTEDFLMRDENADDFLSIDELKQALEDSGYKEGEKKLDIIGMDACYMSMVEVCYELRDHAEILIGAEGLEPEFGWPYSKFLRRVHEELKSVENIEGAARALEPEEAAIILVKEYVEHYEAYDMSVDLAAIRLSDMDALKTDFGSLVTALKGQPDARNNLTYAHWRAQTYKSDQFVDLKDLCDQIESDDLDFDADVKKSAQDIVARLEAVVLQAGCSGFAYQWSHGLSVYFPWAFVSPDYVKPDNVSTGFAKETGWDNFIKEHVEKTRRQPRYDPKPGALSFERRNSLFEECANACLARATIVPFLKFGSEAQRTDPEYERMFTEFLCRLHNKVKERSQRTTDHLEADGMAADEIVQELRSEISKVGRFTPKRTKYMPITHYPKDREMAVKNFAPVVGVAWWPMLPEKRMRQVR
jgi:hypothetical protein